MHGLYLVKRRLLSEIAKNKATPAQRLLDVLLDMLEPDASPDVQELVRPFARFQLSFAEFQVMEAAGLGNLCGPVQTGN